MFLFTELIRSLATTLEELFPGYNGVLPPIKEFPQRTTLTFPNFRQLGGRKMISYAYSVTFLARGHAIVGWQLGNHINPLCTFFQRENVFVVFDTIKDQWDALSEVEFHKLGPNRLLPLVSARDEVAATHHLETGRPILDAEAHIRAVKQANLEADRVEREQVKAIKRVEITLQQSARLIKEGYSYIYIRTFHSYLQERAGVGPQRHVTL